MRILLVSRSNSIGSVIPSNWITIWFIWPYWLYLKFVTVPVDPLTSFLAVLLFLRNMTRVPIESLKLLSSPAVSRSSLSILANFSWALTFIFLKWHWRSSIAGISTISFDDLLKSMALLNSWTIDLVGRRQTGNSPSCAKSL